MMMMIRLNVIFRAVIIVRLLGQKSEVATIITMKIIIILLHVFQFTFATQRIECKWGEEYLCGDKCLRIDRTCFCGNETINYPDSYDYYCCNYESCFQNNEANIVCHGKVTFWNEVCGENCAQNARTGWTMLKCEKENTCYVSATSCNGMTLCEE